MDLPKDTHERLEALERLFDVSLGIQSIVV